MNILVTGCAGFIGSYISRVLTESGHSVTGVDSVHPDASPLVRWRLHDIAGKSGFAYRMADIRDHESIRGAFHDRFASNFILAVIHLAAKAGVRTSVDNPRLCYETNVHGTLNILELCREFEVSQFVLASTSSVYGNQGGGLMSEDVPSNRPLSPYAASKSAAETLLHSYHHLHGMDAVVLRYFTVYGPGGRTDMSVSRFIRAIAEKEPITVYGDGTQRRDFTYVDDVARGTVAALGLRGFQTINLENDRPVSVNELIGIIESAVGCSALVQYQERHEADPSLTWAEIGQAQKLLGWTPEVDIEEGIRRTVAWYMENREWAKHLV